MATMVTSVATVYACFSLGPILCCNVSIQTRQQHAPSCDKFGTAMSVCVWSKPMHAFSCVQLRVETYVHKNQINTPCDKSKKSCSRLDPAVAEHASQGIVSHHCLQCLETLALLPAWAKVHNFTLLGHNSLRWRGLVGYRLTWDVPVLRSAQQLR